MYGKESGQTLMELVVVISVSIIVIGGLVFAIISSLRNAQFAKNQAQATKLAQEGIERVRSGRDRNLPISIPQTDVTSWDGNSTSACPESAAIKSDSVWCYRITGNTPVGERSIASFSEDSSRCEDLTSRSKCYFTVDASGSLTNTGYSQTFSPQDCTAAECIPSNDSPVFRRVVTLSDEPEDDLYKVQKTVTVIVRWIDFSGVHESRLTTILRKI